MKILTAFLIMTFSCMGLELPKDLKSALDSKDSVKSVQKFTKSAGLYVAEFIQDKAPMGRGAAGVFKEVELKIIKSLRGPLEEGKKYNLKRKNKNNLRFGNNQVKDDFGPGFYIIEVNEHVRNLSFITHIEKAEPANIKIAVAASKMPLAWSIKEGKIVNPWGDDREPQFLPEGVSLNITPVAPVKEIKWTNPDGDGFFKIMITNNSGKSQEIAALQCKGSEILWAKSVLNGSQGKFQIPIVVKGDKSPTEGKVILEPGKSVSCEINALKMKGITWPKGGYRLNLEFCIGKQVKVHSFYYMSRHHDKLRKQ